MEKVETKPPRGRVRYFVAFMAFAMCSLVNIHRLILGVAIVAMVKPLHVEEGKYVNFTTTSCPISTEGIEKDIIRGGDLDWNSEVQGYVLGVGFFSNILTQLPGGGWAEKWGAKKILFTGHIVTSICTLITPISTWWNVYAVIAVQFIRGLAQGICIPGVFVLMSRWFPRQERGCLSSLVMCGFAFGAPLGGVVAGWLSDLPQLGWPAAFYTGGIFAALTSILFVFVVYETPQTHPSISPEELKYITDGLECDLTLTKHPTPWNKMLTSIPVYALIFGLLGHYWSDTHFLSVHPTYMGTILHFSMTKNGAVSTMPVMLKSVGGLFGSFLTSWITKNNYIRTNNLRKSLNFVGSFGFSAALFGVYWGECDKVVNVFCFSLSLFCIGVSISGALITAGDMSPRFSGSLIGFASTVASLLSFPIPIMVGSLTKNQTIEEWHTVFFISIAIVFSCELIFNIFGSAEIQPWNDPEPIEKNPKQESDFVDNESTITRF